MSEPLAVDTTLDAAGILAALSRTPLDGAAAQRLAEFLTTADERELWRFNPAKLATVLERPRRQALEALGHALRAGVIDLNWEVRCPSCGGQEPVFKSLTEATSEHECEGCELHFHAHLDDEMVITATVSQRVRSLSAVNEEDLSYWFPANAGMPQVTSHELLTLQVFRDLFINEPLPEGENFQVKHLALLFTDLGGSTALYARQGDPRAYSLVREHFRLLFATVAEYGGAVVKTIGDAIMAVFPSGDLAIRAALGAQAAIARFNTERDLEASEALRLKVGVHAGPALAVNLNDRLDYFGTVVNTASRVQGQAAPDETIITTAALEDGAVELPATARNDELTLRGLDDVVFSVVRVPAA